MVTIAMTWQGFLRIQSWAEPGDEQELEDQYFGEGVLMHPIEIHTNGKFTCGLIVRRHGAYYDVAVRYNQPIFDKFLERPPTWTTEDCQALVKEMRSWDAARVKGKKELKPWYTGLKAQLKGFGYKRMYSLCGIGTRTQYSLEKMVETVGTAKAREALANAAD